MQAFFSKVQKRTITNYFQKQCGGAAALLERKMNSVMAAKQEAQTSKEMKALFQNDAREATRQLLFLYGLLDPALIQNKKVFHVMQAFLFAN